MLKLNYRVWWSAVALFVLLFSNSAFAQQPNCIQYGGYPFIINGCINAQDINQAFNLSPGPLPPQNNNGQGAQQYKFWVDTSTIGPSGVATLRQCVSPSGCHATFNSSEWSTWGTINPNTGALVINATVPSANILTTRKILAPATSDIVNAQDQVIEWDSTATSAKTELLPACNGANIGKPYIIVDGLKNAATYNITINASVGQTINGSSSLVMASNAEGIGVFCDGTSNWVVYVSALVNRTFSSDFTVTGTSVALTNTGVSAGLYSCGDVTVSVTGRVTAATAGCVTGSSFNPNIAFGGGSTGLTYLFQQGRYQTAQRFCHFEGSLTLATVGSSTGTATITLPFAPNSSGQPEFFPISTSLFPSLLNLMGTVYLSLTPGATIANLYQWTPYGWQNITNTNFVNGISLSFSIDYQL